MKASMSSKPGACALALFLLLVGCAASAQEQPASALISPAPLKLTIHMHFRDKYVWNEDWPVAKEVARLTNVSLVNTASKVATNSQQQFNLLMVSRKLPDIVGGDGLKDAFIRGGMEGAFQPLNRLIDQHAPHLKAFLAENPLIARSITAPDGNIYYIPYVPDGTVSRGWWIRQDWLDKLGLKTPQTVDELHDVLVAFRDRDPNGNGKKDEVPYFNAWEYGVYRLVVLWGARSSGSNTKMDWIVENGKIVHPFTEERFKFAIQHVAQWYAEGLIDKEIFTRKARSREQLLSANLGGVTQDWFASTSTYNDPRSIPSRVPGFKFAVMAPPADIHGRRFEEDSRKLVTPDGWAISYTNQHAVETIKLFDFYFSPIGRRLSNFGVEGQQYTLVDGKPTFKKSMLSNGKPINSQLWAVGAQIPIGFRQDYAYEAQWTFPAGLAGREMYLRGNYILPQFPGVNMTPKERLVYDRYYPELLTYMDEMAQNWVLGSKDVDKTWDSYQRQLDRLGYHKVLAVMQSAYDRQYGAASSAVPAPAAQVSSTVPPNRKP
jgi:putative aldouronate transport system substrate-binding protein